MLLGYALMIATTQVTPADIPLDEIAGVRLGDTVDVARTALSKFGTVTEQAAERAGTQLKSGDAEVMLCKGRVVQIVRVLGSSAHDFAKIGGMFSEAHGVPQAELFGFDGSRPATDPEGPLTISMSVIRLKWEKAPLFFLGFKELNGDLEVSEILNAETNPCGEPRPAHPAS